MELIREINDGINANTPKVVYNNYLKEFGNQDKEFFIVLGLDTKNKIIYREIVTIGGLNSSIVEPRGVFKKAVLMSCNALILAHNHPSQDLEPSDEDLQVTKILKQGGEILGIKILDHLIFNAITFKSIMGDF
jgi:DNA repair protein RadC